MERAFTYEQAEEICEDFEDLQDTELRIRNGEVIVDCVIEHVAIVPFADTDKYNYLQAYREHGNPADALATYTGNAYDVLIIAQNVFDSKDIVTQTIDEYINSNGVRYNFPEAD